MKKLTEKQYQRFCKLQDKIEEVVCAKAVQKCKGTDRMVVKIEESFNVGFLGKETYWTVEIFNRFNGSLVHDTSIKVHLEEILEC